MSASSHMNVRHRRKPRQERGERRVEGLLEAAEAVLGEVGYEAATMTDIAERAGACIGSLYQFFPNKLAITQALRIRCTEEFDEVLSRLEVEAAQLSLDALVTRLVNITAKFLENHSGFLALLHAPANTRIPVAVRRTLQERVARMLIAKKPRISKPQALRLALVSLQLLKAMNEIYAEVQPRLRKAFVQEFRVALLCYLKARMEIEESKRA